MTMDSFKPWPCVGLANYPLDSHWTDVFPEKNLSKYHYAHIVNATRSFFLSPALADTYAQLRNYAFQQGAFSNANKLDMEFFYSILSHDFPFFLGNKGNEIQSAFQIDGNKYRGMGHLKCSHFDLYRVEKSFGSFAQLSCLTGTGMINALFPFMSSPKRDDIVFARVLPLGWTPRHLAFSVVEPWDTVDPANIEKILSVFNRQYRAFCAKFPNTSTRAFCKIAAYHLYELLQAEEIRPILNQKLEHLNDTVYARNISIKFPSNTKMISLMDIPGACPVKGDDDVLVPDLVTVPICTDASVPQTLREAIISKEKRTLEITLFMHQAGQNFMDKVFNPLVENRKTIQTVDVLDDNEMYRALRHLSLS